MQSRIFSFYSTKLPVSWAAILTLIVSLLWTTSLYAQPKWKSYDDLFSISFPNKNDGWACGRWGTILHTKDGGKTWIRQPSGIDFTLTSIFFINAKTGWAVGNIGTIVHTKNGGKTWQTQKSPVAYFHMDVFFVTPLKGWVVSERTHILATQNGGKSWELQFKDEDYILKSISFSDAQNGWAVGEFGYTYHTGNSGKTWEKQAGDCYIDIDTGALVGEDFLFDVTAIDAKTAWAVGIEGLTTMTSDSGKTWTTVETKAPKTPLYCIAYDHQTGSLVIGGKGICMYSLDRGKSWQKAIFEPILDYGWIYGLSHQGDGHFVAGGDEGTIYLGAVQKKWNRVQY